RRAAPARLGHGGQSRGARPGRQSLAGGAGALQPRHPGRVALGTAPPAPAQRRLAALAGARPAGGVARGGARSVARLRRRPRGAAGRGGRCVGGRRRHRRPELRRVAGMVGRRGADGGRGARRPAAPGREV
ncbi:MAG: hypothetical protein AVDCRST_MAG04-3112, partial [uncultured Acetobacteraceae bacterium]